MSDFSQKVRDTRNALGWSQEELARNLGVSFATVNRWENNKTSPSKLALEKIESFFKMAKNKKDDK